MNCVRKKTFVFTGGGSAGHVTPNLALIEACSGRVQCYYIGMRDSIEQEMLSKTTIPFYGITAGKLRRYMTFKHLTEPFKVFMGLFQSYSILKKIKPDVVFSKGGFVSVPVAMAAWMQGIPVIAHESDMTPGLANRLTFPFVQKLCVNFSEVKKFFKHPEDVYVTGTPVRAFLLHGSKEKALELTKFDKNRLTILVIGGSLGSVKINDAVRQALPSLLMQYQVIHICGKGNLDPSLNQTPQYYQVEFAGSELADLLALSDVVVSRAGANTLCELLTLGIPHLLIPLSKKASRGDQIDNARYFEKKGASMVLWEEQLNVENLTERLTHLIEKRQDFSEKIKAIGLSSATEKVLNVIDETLGYHSTL